MKPDADKPLADIDDIGEFDLNDDQIPDGSTKDEGASDETGELESEDDSDDGVDVIGDGDDHDATEPKTLAEALKGLDPKIAAAINLAVEAGRSQPSTAGAAEFVVSIPESVRQRLFAGSKASASIQRLEKAADVIRRGYAARREKAPSDLYDRAFRAEFGRSAADVGRSIKSREKSALGRGRRSANTMPTDARSRAILAVAEKMREINGR